MTPTKRFRQMLSRPGVILAGGVGDAGQARLVESVGYPAVYVSGAYVNHTRGYPDGILTLSEISERLREITDRVSIPVIADADDGYGGIVHIVRTVRDFERAGVAALHLEDMSVKKHGRPMPVEQMLDHLKAALDARTDPDLVIVARTDAVAPWRSDIEKNYASCEQEAFDRSMAYGEAGADMLMPLFASTRWLRTHGPALPKPIMVLPPDVRASELESANVKVVLYATSMLTRAHRFMKRQYTAWLEQDMFDATEVDLSDRVEAHDMVGMREKEELLARYSKQ